MTHTGDIYEKRARAARHQALRSLASALSGLLFHVVSTRNAKRSAGFDASEPANDLTSNRKRAA